MSRGPLIVRLIAASRQRFRRNRRSGLHRCGRRWNSTGLSQYYPRLSDLHGVTLLYQNLRHLPAGRTRHFDVRLFGFGLDLQQRLAGPQHVSLGNKDGGHVARAEVFA